MHKKHCLIMSECSGKGLNFLKEYTEFLYTDSESTDVNYFRLAFYNCFNLVTPSYRVNASSTREVYIFPGEVLSKQYEMFTACSFTEFRCHQAVA
jgi:hypothetical protein